jgi:hypothetical protein
MKAHPSSTRLLVKAAVYTTGIIAAIATPLIASAEVYEIDFSCSYRCQAELGPGFIQDGDLWVFDDCTSGPNGSATCVYRRIPTNW